MEGNTIIRDEKRLIPLCCSSSVSSNNERYGAASDLIYKAKHFLS